MKKILVPTDFSKYAKDALELACEIALKTNGEILLVHILDIPARSAFNTIGEITIDDATDVYIIESIKEAQESLQEQINEVSSDGVAIKYDVKIGNPFDSIGKEMARFESDLVVMGTKGVSGLEEILIGSNAEKMVRFAKCPVITVSDRFNLDSINNIVFATDLSEKQDAVIQKLKEFQHLVNASIHLVWIKTVHIIENEKEVKEELKQFAARNQLVDYSINVYKSVTPDSGIMYFAEETDADLIALGTHGRKGLAHIFSGSMAEDIVNHANRPVWTYSLKAIN